ncbi:uncharacterized protein SCHCODRAFT_02322286 [Schizophyllum commune H4-8]|nr:uncharacterized protein SCHCODRAFT_02322286 [Schizophyllum commune H4-8]KAI5891560.1 hypothetical protein SCHCODRAFT_02322286 [Schizophyllum commune H4-8]
MSSSNNANSIAQGNASAINGTAALAANANAFAPAVDAAADIDTPLNTSEAGNNKSEQPFQDAFLKALKTAVEGANHFVNSDKSANFPEARLLCSAVENMPGQTDAGADEVPEAMDDLSKHIIQSLRDGAFTIQELFPLQPGEVEPQPKANEEKFPLWPAMVHKSFNIQDVSQRYVPVSAMPVIDPALPYAFHIDRDGVEMPIDFPFTLSFEPKNKKHKSMCVEVDVEEEVVPAAAASTEVEMEEVPATRGTDDADDAAPRCDTRLATGGKGKGTGGKDKGKGKTRAEPEPASDSELSELTESETDELSSLSELTESEDEEPAPKPAGRHAKKPAAKPAKVAPKAPKAAAPRATKAATTKATKAATPKETKAPAPRATRAAAPRLVKAAPKKAAEPAPKQAPKPRGMQAKGKEPAAAPRATRGAAATSRLIQSTAASKARATAATSKAAGATKAKAAPAPKATKAPAASKPTAAPRAPSRAAAGKRKRDDDDEDAAPVAQRRIAAAARVSPPAAPAVRAQAGHNLRRTKAVSYKV